MINRGVNNESEKNDGFFTTTQNLVPTRTEWTLQQID